MFGFLIGCFWLLKKRTKKIIIVLTKLESPGTVLVYVSLVVCVV